MYLFHRVLLYTGEFDLNTNTLGTLHTLEQNKWFGRYAVIYYFNIASVCIDILSCYYSFSLFIGHGVLLIEHCGSLEEMLQANISLLKASVFSS